MNFRQQLGANLKRLREGADLSQEELMRIADVHRTQISNYERGETEPQAEILARLSRALGVSVEELFAGVGWQQDPPRLVVALPTERALAGQSPPAAVAVIRSDPRTLLPGWTDAVWRFWA